MSCLHLTVTSPDERRGMALSALDEQAETLQAFRCVYACSPSIDACLWSLAIYFNSHPARERSVSPLEVRLESCGQAYRACVGM
jgi:hypothetical protein